MSTTHATATNTVPDGLTPNAAAVYAALHAQPGQTPVELAQATGLGRSTVSKILVILKTAHLAGRERSTSSQHGRQPDRWHLTGTTNGTTEICDDPTNDTSNAAEGDNTAETSANTPERGARTDTDELQAGEVNTSPDGSSETLPAETETETPDNAEERHSPADGDAAPTETVNERTESQTSGRLGQGGLRALVLAYLRSHPGEATSPTKISRELGRSSGAIANALVTLVNLGHADMVTSKPRTYQLKLNGHPA